MSDRGIPATYRHMHGFGCTPSASSTPTDERFWVKFHFKTQQGIENLTDAEAAALIGNDRESHQRDLLRGHRARRLPEVEAVRPGHAGGRRRDGCRINPFDLTKVWPHEDYPLIEVGVLELNRNPENYFAEVEQAAFKPANVVPGIGFSPDKMLQGAPVLLRRRAALPARRQPPPDPGQRRRAARCTATTATAPCASTATTAARSDYEPNSYGEWAEQPASRSRRCNIDGAADHWNHREDNDDYSQPGDLFRLMTPGAAAGAVRQHRRARWPGVPEVIQRRHIGHCAKADPAYGAGVAERSASRPSSAAAE